MNRNDQNRTPKNKVNWSSEVKDSGKLAGKIVSRFFSYLLNIILTIMLICFITGIIVCTVFAVYVKNYIDPEVDLSLFSIQNTNQTTKVYYMDFTDRENRIGELVELEDQRLYGSENSIWVKYNDIPENLVNAVISIEDERFWDHNGVDWIRTIGAVINYFIPIRENFGGGSTLTQQLIKNITDEDDYSPQRKIQEILRALNLEKKLDKTQILELYMNNVNLSQNCYGVQAAANTYFNKDVSELTLIECASLASILKSPTKYDPVINPENNKDRRNLVLSKMLELGKITEEEFNSAYDKELTLDYQGHAQDVELTTNSWYTDQVMIEVRDALMEELGYTREMAYNLIYGGGLSIVTLQDPEVQAVLDEVYLDDDSFPKTNNAIQPQSSAIVIDPATGDVLGIAGARGQKEGNLLLNYATQTTRSPGSSIKPLSVYAPALEAGLITYGSVYDDVPVWFNYDDEDVEKKYPTAYPKNLPEVYNGLTTVNDAVTRSVNTVALRVLQDLTLDTSFNFVKSKLQMDSFIEYAELSGGVGITDKGWAPIALGAMTYGVTNLEITAAYQIFANGGVFNKPRTWLYVLDNEGNVLIENETDSYVVISEQTASIMTKMLESVVDRGTATAVTLKNSVDVAGKTGTAASDVDRWFVGYTPYYVCGVWFGYDTPSALGTLAWTPTAVAWDIIMTKLHQNYIDKAKSGGEPLKTFEMADGIVTATYCKDSGKLMTEACYLDPRGNRAETGYFTTSTVPTEYCDCHVLVDYDTSTGAVASPRCPSEYVTKVGLIKVDREFPMQVKVTDAQYTYRDVPDGTGMPLTGDLPFYIGLYESGTYPGYTATGGARVFNSYCYEHHALEPEPEPENPDGTVDPSNPDGTVDPNNPDGTVDPNNPDGTVDPSNPDGTVDPSNPDGVVDPDGDAGIDTGDTGYTGDTGAAGDVSVDTGSALPVPDTGYEG